ncbi:MAG: hypothetical protein EOL87_15750 [Spartobacteria bacterium]|nr:hypothetical protein [Spartobacteria bacterium]
MERSSGNNGATNNSLIIEPYIMQIKFIGKAARAGAGCLAGSSIITVRMTYKDAETGEILAAPEFQKIGSTRSWSYAEAYTMIDQTVLDITTYTVANN